MDGIDGIKRELEAHRRTGELQYSPELRAKVGSWVRAARGRGMKCGEIAGALGMAWTTLSRWSASEASSAKPHAAECELVPVKVIGAAQLSLVTPSGHRLEGLCLSDAITLLRGLG